MRLTGNRFTSILVMATDYIRYDILAQSALRGVVRTVLIDVAKKGLPGDHHFKITFSTTAPGVRLSDRMRAQYPETMTVILQHQFWDLRVDDDGFEVGLSFGGVPERLGVPFEAVTAFFDPAVQFGFQFETLDAVTATGPVAVPAPNPAADKPASASAADKAGTPSPASGSAAAEEGPPTPPAGGAEVVRLDRFRKK